MRCRDCGQVIDAEGWAVCRACAARPHVVAILPIDHSPPRLRPQQAGIAIALLGTNPIPEPDPLPLDDIIKEIPMTTRRSPATSAAVIAAAMAASLNVAPDGRVGTDNSKAVNVRRPSDDDERVGRPLYGGLGLAQLITIAARRRRARQTHPRKRWRGAVC